MSTTPLQQPQRRYLIVLALSALIMGLGGGLAWRNDPSLFDGFRRLSPAPSMSQGKLERITFGPPDTNLMFGVPSVSARLIDGQVKISERCVIKTVQRTRSKEEIAYLSKSTGTPISRIPAREAVTRLVKSRAKTAIWMGPVSEAQFVHEMAGGVDTLKDRRGKILWTNAGEAAKADLVLQSTQSGEARLLGKKGTLLWQGTLPAEERPSPRNTPPPPARRDELRERNRRNSQNSQNSQNSHSNRSRTSHYARQLVQTHQIVEYGIHINGVNGQFTIADNNKRHL